MENDPDRVADPPVLALYEGIVVDRADPLGIGRLKIRVPGMFEPSTGWAFPLSMSRGDGVGFFFVPKVGALVGVWLLEGDRDRPYYVPGHWTAPSGHGRAPSSLDDVPVEERPDVACWETDRHVLTFDGRASSPSFEIRDKTTGDRIAYDGLQRAMDISATVAIRIHTIGTVDIDGLSVTIAGRPVLRNGRPIT